LSNTILMETILLGDYTIFLTGKEDGNSRTPDYRVHDTYTSIHQIHKNIIVDADSLSSWWHQDIEGDALCTSHTPIGVHVADCVPIALLGQQWYAVIHGSWKTLQTGIVQNTVKNLCRHGEEIVDIDVYIWPSIRKESYEVGQEFYALFPHHTAIRENWLVTLDMVGWVHDTFIALGWSTEQLSIHPDCTYVHTTKWWSRRQGDIKGRNFMGVRRN
jgi:copper oxidase (laccase) domain-containing protein